MASAGVSFGVRVPVRTMGGKPLSYVDSALRGVGCKTPAEDAVLIVRLAHFENASWLRNGWLGINDEKSDDWRSARFFSAEALKELRGLCRRVAKSRSPSKAAELLPNYGDDWDTYDSDYFAGVRKAAEVIDNALSAFPSGRYVFVAQEPLEA